MVDNALGVLPAVVRANLLPITALTAVGVYAIWTHATANSASGSGKSYVPLAGFEQLIEVRGGGD